jgi:hypothetical protein
MLKKSYNKIARVELSNLLKKTNSAAAAAADDDDADWNLFNE